MGISHQVVRLAFSNGTIEVHGLPEGDPRVPAGCRWDARSACHRAAAQDYADIVMSFVRGEVPYEDEARDYPDLAEGLRVRREPRPYQRDAIAAWRKARGRGVVVLPTGAGKSYVAMMAIDDRRRSALVVAPTLDLVRQWYDNLRTAFGQDVGIVGGGEHRVLPLTVTTYDSAYIHMPRFGARFGLIVFDECHHLPGPCYGQGAEMAIAPFRLGLTATPERSDGSHDRLDTLIGPQVFRRDIQEMAGEYLAGYEVVRLAVALTPEERAAYDAARATYRSFLAFHRLRVSEPGGWQRFIGLSSRSHHGRQAWAAWREQKQIALRSEGKLRVLWEILKSHPTEQVIIFTADNETVYALSRTHLIPAITHQTKTPERQWILKAFNAGELRAVVTSKVLNEGVDMPAASVGIVLSGSSSVREHVQRLGRILRRQEGKEATLYEVVTAGTGEEHMSERRREHDAYR